MSLRNRNEPSFRRIFPIISSESQGLPHLHNHWTNQRKARKLEMKRSDSKNNSNNRRIKLVSLCLAAAHLPTISKAQFCKPLHNNTWAGLVQAVVDSSGFAVLCPFEISGARCHSKQQRGYVVPEEQDQIIVCDPFLYGFNSDSSECIINCPGRHFTVGHSSSLTLNNMKLFGATDSSIQVEKHGKLSVIDSVFRGNSALGNGGAINALESSNLDIEYSLFMNNDAVIGGAINNLGTAGIIQSVFLENTAFAAGGAIATEAGSNLVAVDTQFHFNRASSGGALYVSGYSNLDVRATSFDSNFALDGGAIYNRGVSSMYDSTFLDNFSEDGGGAIDCDGGSTTLLKNNAFMNNKSGGYGPAVRNRYNSEVLKKDNVACGNTHQSGTVGCDGIFVWISRRRVRCLKFEERCVAPTQEPTETPTAAPTHPPSQSPSFGPTQLPSSIPSSTPTYMPSVFPTEHEPSSKPSQSHPPSASPSLTRVPTEFPTTSSSDSPTILASVMPSLLPSASQSTNPTSLLDDRTKPNPNGFPISGVSGLSDAPTNIQSSIPSDKPSLVPSMDLQSSIPSDAPSLVPSMLPTV